MIGIINGINKSLKFFNVKIRFSSFRSIIDEIKRLHISVPRTI